MSGQSATQRLQAWPRQRPAALVVIARQPAPALAAALKARLQHADALKNYWWLEPENAIAGDTPQAAYDWAVLLEWTTPRAALACLSLIREHPEGAGVAVHLGATAPPLAQFALHALQAVLKHVPIRISEPPPDTDARWLGGVNPSAGQIAFMRTLAQHEAIGVLNLHRYHTQAADPYTGTVQSGRALARRYLNRGLLTFTRVGGRISWAAAGRGQLHGPPEPAWHEMALVWYPGRAAFESMLGNKAFHRVVPYRKAALSVADVSMARISDCSQPRLVREAGQTD